MLLRASFIAFLILGLGCPGVWAGDDCLKDQLRALISPELRSLSKKADHHYNLLIRYQRRLSPGSELSKRAEAGDRVAKRALQDIQQKLNETESELDRLNKVRHQEIKRIREPDSGPGVARLEELESELLKHRARLRQVQAEFNESEILAKHLALSVAEQDRMRQRIADLKTELTKTKTELASIHARYEELAAQYPPELRLKQLTGREIRPGELPPHMETPDPTFYRTEDGRFLVLGSGRRYFTYESIHQYLRGERGVPNEFDLRYPDGTKLKGPYHTGELPWDLSIVRWENGKEVMYGGALSPKRVREGGLPSDPGNTTVIAENWTRSGFAFEKRLAVVDPKTGKESIYPSYEAFVSANQGKGLSYFRSVKPSEVWVRREKDIFGRKIGATEDWNMHNYGRRIRTNPDGSVWRDTEGHAWVVYERVIGRDGRIGDTMIFTRRMKNEFETTGDEYLLMGTSYQALDPKTGKPVSVTYPVTKRSGGLAGLTLVEGPNPSADRLKPSDFTPPLDPKKYHNDWEIVALASGDYPTKEYGMHVGLRKVLPLEPGDQTKAITPITERLQDGTLNLKDLAKEIRDLYAISWGPSRPDFFKDPTTGQWWVMFHGIDETVLPKGLNGRVWPSNEDIDKFHRNIYLCPVRWKMNGGRPLPELIHG